MIGKKNIILGSLAVAFLFAGCHHDKTYEYKLTFTNLTASQPFAPTALIIQNSGTSFEAYNIGSSASVGLENLAEGGDPTTLINEAKSANVLYTNTLANIQSPGTSKTITITVDRGDLNLTILAMPVKTNDAFVGAKNIDLNFTGTKTFNLNVYDGGTEANTETTATVPGLGGQGFNATRDDVRDAVSLHTGVVTSDDGLSTSNLTSVDKFDNPAGRLIIERIY